MPVAFTKQASGSAAVRARAPTATYSREPGDRVERRPRHPAEQEPWNVSHSLAKPLSGGRPLIAAAPDPEREGGQRHHPGQPTEPVEVAACRSPPGRRRRPGTAAP